jgi:CubicO group peptidase (beta-lactamase class C family)
LAELTQATFNRVRDAAAGAVERLRLPGLAVGVVGRDGLAYSEAFGYADIESRTPLRADHRQRIGSITKTMLGLCLMALVEKGRLSLDQRIVELLPDVPLAGEAEAVTLRHLLTHTAGIGEVPSPEDIRDADSTLWSETADLPAFSEYYPRGLLVEVPPGTKWAYANQGFVLLGEVLARTEGAPVPEVLRRRVFEPLGMTNSDCLDRPHPALSTGYHRAPDADARELAERVGGTVKEEPTVDGTNIRGAYLYIRGVAAGAVQSTIPDMASYAAALLGRGGGIVSPETFDEMVAPHWQPDGRLIGWGLSFQRMPRFGRITFGHGGGVLGGWNTMLTVSPDDGIAVLVHGNISFDKFAEADGPIVAAALGASPEIPVGVAPPADVLAAAPGVYEAEPGTLTNFRIITAVGRVQIAAVDGGLRIYGRRGKWKRGAPLLPRADDPLAFVVDDGSFERPLLVLRRGRAGGIDELRFDRLVRMVRTDRVAPWA